MLSADAIRQHVAQRVEYLTGARRSDLLDCCLDRDLRMDPDDFVDLCEELERTYAINLRPFFEDGVPMRRWWIFWKHPVARDVSVKELADQIATMVASG